LRNVCRDFFFFEFKFFSWVGLVGKNYEIECAIVELEKEMNNLRKQRKSNGVTSVVEQ
jgi:hypothetical protein